MSRYVVLLVLLAVAYAVSESTPECPVNQYWYICGNMCEPTCDNPHPNPEWCPRIQCTEFTSACRCQKGYLRNTTSHECVAPEDC